MKENTDIHITRAMVIGGKPISLSTFMTSKGWSPTFMAKKLHVHPAKVRKWMSSSWESIPEYWQGRLENLCRHHKSDPRPARGREKARKGTKVDPYVEAMLRQYIESMKEGGDI